MCFFVRLGPLFKISKPLLNRLLLTRQGQLVAIQLTFERIAVGATLRTRRSADDQDQDNGNESSCAAVRDSLHTAPPSSSYYTGRSRILRKRTE